MEPSLMADFLDRQRRTAIVARMTCQHTQRGGSRARIEGPPRPYFGPVALLALTVVVPPEAVALPQCLPNCAGASLYESTLQSADLSGANLPFATLAFADLSGADLSGATLVRADLSSADLRGATLTSAPLVGADLTDANLHGANLSGANLPAVAMVNALGCDNATVPQPRLPDC